MLRQIPINQIDRRADARAVDRAAVAALAESIRTVGLINPIRVRAAGAGWEVTAGVHRLEACRSIGLADIVCDVVDDDDLHAELAMIDENLCGSELSPSDRARQTARRKAIYLELHPETAAHVAGGHAKHDTASDNLSFAASTAVATGKDERSVQRDAERGEKVIDEALNLIRGTKRDTGAYLDKIKKLSPNDQVAAVKRDLAIDRDQDRDKDRKKADRAKQAKSESDVKSRATNTVAEILKAHVPADWWDALAANLYAAGAANIATKFSELSAQRELDQL